MKSQFRALAWKYVCRCFDAELGLKELAGADVELWIGSEVHADGVKYRWTIGSRRRKQTAAEVEAAYQSIQIAGDEGD